MNTRDRIMVGALGGFAPVLLNLLVVDLMSVFQEMTPVAVAAYAVRAAALVMVGAIVGWLNDDEVKASKLFQLGMAAPALLTGTLNAAAIRADAPNHGPVAAAWSITVPLHAQSVPAAPATLRVVEESFGQQLLRGLTGIQREQPNMVLVVEQPKTANEARKRFLLLSREYPLADLQVWRPSAGFTTWTITVHGQLTEAEALRMKDDVASRKDVPPVRLTRLPDVK